MQLVTYAQVNIPRLHIEHHAHLFLDQLEHPGPIGAEPEGEENWGLGAYVHWKSGMELSHSRRSLQWLGLGREQKIPSGHSSGRLQSKETSWGRICAV